MNILNFIQSTKKNRGASYNIETGEFNPESGYMVSISNHEYVISSGVRFKDAALAAEIKDYALKNADLLMNGDIFLGSWVQGADIYLDCSRRFLDKREALEFGMLNNQLAIYDAENKVSITLPTPQRSGTEYQKRSYIKMKVQEILDRCAV